MWPQLRTSVVVLGSLTVLTGVVYPLSVTLFGQVVAPNAANGSIREDEGLSLGSDLIGQPFTRPDYFWGRLSATSQFPYNASASSGSNFGPTHPDLVKSAQERLAALRDADPTITTIPLDLLTASGSGLDPHISPAAALVQVKRVAAARQMTNAAVQELVEQHTQPRQFGILGEPCVNVLRLNIALDRRTRQASAP